MSITFDHLVLLVNDLDVAERDFTELGFTVLERADTSHGSTIFKFISFADGSYILLTAFTSEEGMKGHRLGEVMSSGEGWADYSFVVPDAKAAGDALVAGGFVAKGPVPVSNVLAGGERWGLDLLMTGRGSGGNVALPFLVSDVEGRNHRIPGPTSHPNGATGIRNLSVSSDDPRRVADTLIAIGGKEEQVDGAIRIRFDQVHVDILGLNDVPEGRPGGGIITVDVIGGPNVPQEGQLLDSKLTHGAPIRLVRG